MAQAFQIDNILTSLAKEYNNGLITIEQAGRELCQAGWFPYVPSEAQTRRLLHV